MAKIIRATQKLFGLNGPTGDFGQFGSLAAGSAAFTKDPATIQALSAWLTGWAAETIANNRPALEDFNSVDYLAFYQICYMLQMGMPEWDSGTTYYANSYAQVSGTIYKSLQDDNLNKDPSVETAYWEPLSFLPAGITVDYGGTTAPSGGWLLCDGSAVSRTTYAALFAAIGTTFGIGDGSTTFNLPDTRGRFTLGKAASGTGSALGETGGEIDHDHGPGTYTSQNHQHGPGSYSVSVPQGCAGGAPGGYGGSASSVAVSGSSSSAGAAAITGLSDTNNPPYIAFNKIIKT